jgi:parvulin-like peptidyl-prolyl isomerase
MPTSAPKSPLASAFAGSLAALLGACTSVPQPPEPAPPQPRPVALVNNQALDARELLPALLESDGAQVLADWVLDRAIERELAAKSITIDESAQLRERQLLIDSIATAGDAGPDAGARLIAGARAQRGLGEQRFAALLRRNAALRALVRDRVKVTVEQARLEFDLEHGPRARVRLITTPTPELAREVLRQLGPGPVTPASFAQLAQRFSTDPSAAQGGTVGVLSPADPSLPAAMRDALRTVREGEASSVIALTRGWGIIFIEQSLPPTGVRFEDVQSLMLARARLAGERIEMERLARALLDAQSVTPLDPALAWSWRQRPTR